MASARLVLQQPVKPCELEVDLLDLRLPQRELAVLALEQSLLLREFAGALGKLLVLLLESLLHLRDQRGSFRGQLGKVDGERALRAKHAQHGARALCLAPLEQALSTGGGVAPGRVTCE